MTPKFKIGNLELEPADFESVVEMRMPRALARLIVHLGSCLFVLDEKANVFVPTPDADEICRIVEGGDQARAEELKRAIKAAYDAYAALPTPPEGRMHRPVP